MKYTDYKKVFELAENIVKDAVELSGKCSELLGDLNVLKGSFHDSGIEEIETYVLSITRSLEEYETSFKLAAAGLVAYGEDLRRGAGH